MYKINAADPLPVISDLECERFMVIPPGQKRTVCVAPLCGVCNSGMFWPLPHCSLSFEFMLQADAEAVCAGQTIGATGASAPYDAVINRSDTWSIELPRLELKLVKLSDVADAEWSSLLAGQGLHKDIDQIVHLQQAVTTKDIRVSFQRSLANVKSMIVTLFTQPFASP